MTSEYNQKIREYNALLEKLKKKESFDKLTKEGKDKFFSDVAEHNPSKELSIEGLRDYIKEKYSEKVLQEMEEEIERKEEEKQGEELIPQVLMLLVNHKRGQATELIVKHILDKEVIYTIRSDQEPEMWIYKEGIYVPQAKSYIQETCRNILGDAFTTHVFNNVIAKIQADTYIDALELFKEPPLNLIAVKNGIFDLETGEIMPFDPNLRFFNKVPVTYDKNAQCPECMKFFDEVLAATDDKDIIQEILGYAFYREYKYHHIFIFEGGGRNGKGVTLNIMKNLVGIDNCSEISIDDITTNPFAKANLHKKLINISGDIGSSSIKNPNILKSLSGGDLQEANRKFLDTVKFVNYSKMIFALNTLPVCYDKSDAFYDRIILITYPRKFVDEKDMKEECDNENLRLKDPDIINKLTTEEEKSGLFNWAVKGLLRLRKNKCFSYNLSTEQIKRLYIRKSNSFEAYCNENLVFGEGQVEKIIIRNDYNMWCKMNKLGRPKGDKVVKNVMEYNGAYSDRMPDGDRNYYWVGVQRKVDLDESDNKMNVETEDVE